MSNNQEKDINSMREKLMDYTYDIFDNYYAFVEILEEFIEAKIKEQLNDKI